MYLSAQFENMAAGSLRAQFPLAQHYWEPRRRTVVCRKPLRTIGNYPGLGAITADAAAQIAMPTSTISKTAGFTQAVYNVILQAAQSGQFVGPFPATCSGGKLSLVKPVITATAGGLALKFGTMAGPAAPVLLAAGAILSIFGAVFAHHTAAVAQEQKVLCGAIPSAQDALASVYDAVSSGVMSPQQGQQALSGILAQFTQTVQPIIKNDAAHCNAACTWVKQLTAIVAAKSSQYQDMIDSTAATIAAGGAAGAVATVQSSVDSAATSLGIPPLLLYAAGGLLLFKLL